MKYSVIIPCYNEADSIRTTTEHVLKYMKENRSQDSFELILVNDGSKDDTKPILEQLAVENKEVATVSFRQNLGRGAAIKAGIKESTGDYVALLDADLSYDVFHLGKIFDLFDEDHRLDVVVISPYMKGGSASGVPANRLLLSKVANWILAGFFENNLSTVTCVVRGYRGSLIRQLPLFENGKELHLEILRKCAISGANIIETPGHLAWKESKKRAQRKGLKVFSTGMKHIWWGMLIKPTRVAKYVAFLFLAIGFYEAVVIVRAFFQHFSTEETFWRSVWVALAATFAQSPHSVVIASISLLLGFQTLFFIMLFQLLKLQQEESLKHLIAIWAQNDQRQNGAR